MTTNSVKALKGDRF